MTAEERTTKALEDFVWQIEWPNLHSFVTQAINDAVEEEREGCAKEIDRLKRQDEVHWKTRRILLAKVERLREAAIGLLRLREETDATYESSYQAMFKNMGKANWDVLKQALTNTEDE